MTDPALLARSWRFAELVATADDPTEEWREVVGKPGYAVSSKRRIFSFGSFQLLKGEARKPMTPWGATVNAFFDGCASSTAEVLRRYSPAFVALIEEGEEWRGIPDEPLYAVSDRGRIFSVRSEKLLQQILSKVRGYLCVNIGEKGPGQTVHTLVAAGFLPVTDPSLTDLDHQDGNKQNNYACNLRRATRQQNARNCRVRENTSGWPGVFQTGPQVWEARIRDPNIGKLVSLGRFTNVVHSGLAYLLAAESLHGEFFSAGNRALLDANRHLIPEIESSRRPNHRTVGVLRCIRERRGYYEVTIRVGGKPLPIGKFASRDGAIAARDVSEEAECVCMEVAAAEARMQE